MNFTTWREGNSANRMAGTIDLEDFFKRYTADQIRYAIASNAPETSDSEFTWKDFQHRCNGELLGKCGNLVNRVLVFIQNRCGGQAPSVQNLEAADEEFLRSIQGIGAQAAESFSHFKLRRASQLIMELAQLGNVFFDSKRPWLDAKQEETLPRMRATLSCCLQCLKTLAVISYPIIPATSCRVWEMLGFKDSLEVVGWERALSEKIPEGQKLPPPSILFQRIDDSVIEEEIQKLKSLSAAG